MPKSILAVARAAGQTPDLIRACATRHHEIVSHGRRWIDHVEVDEATDLDVARHWATSRPAKRYALPHK